jgi:hypothetical protein
MRFAKWNLVQRLATCSNGLKRKREAVREGQRHFMELKVRRQLDLQKLKN